MVSVSSASLWKLATKIQASGTMTMNSRITAAIPNTAPLTSTLRLRAGSSATAFADPTASVNSDSERLAPLLDDLGDALVEPVRLVPIVLHFLDRDPGRRRHVGTQRVVERLRQRLRILLRVEEAFKEPAGVGVRGVLEDRDRRHTEDRVIGRELDVDRIALRLALERRVLGSGPDLALASHDVRHGVEDGAADLRLVLRELREVVPAILVRHRDDPVPDEAGEARVAERDLPLPLRVE